MKLYKHPTYIEKFPLWKKLFDCYQGDHDVMVSPEYLSLHDQENKGTEGGALRGNREKRTRYLNIPEMVVSIWISIFMRDKPTWDEKVTQLFKKTGDADKNIDGNGTTIEQFIKQMLESYLIYGKSIVLADAPPIQAPSKGEEKKIGLRPFLSLIAPLSAVDWSYSNEITGRSGKFNYLRHNYNLIPERARETDAPQIIEMSDSLYFDGINYAVQRYRRKVAEKKIDGAEIPQEDASRAYDDGEWDIDGPPIITGLSEVPVVEICDESWLKDVNEESLRYHNQRSVYDSILLHQCYQKLFAFGVDIGSSDERKALTEYLIAMVANKDGRIESIDPVDPHALESAMEASLSNCMKIALNQLRTLPSSSKAVEGGDTQSESKDNLHALVESTLTEVENCINQALVYFAEFAGQENFDGKIELCKEITDEDTDQFLKIWETFGPDLKQYPTLRGEVLKKATDKLNLPEDMIDEIKTEIDEKPEGEPVTDNAQVEDSGDTQTEVDPAAESDAPASDVAQAA